MIQELKSRLDGHFVACSAVAAAAAVGGVAQNAEGAIVWSGAVNITIPSNSYGVYLNLVTGATGGSGGAVPGWDVNPYNGSGLSFYQNSLGTTYLAGGGPSGTNIGNQPLGTTIGLGGPWANGLVMTAGLKPFVLNSSDNLVGFRFVSDTDSQTHYGWMRIQLSGPQLYSQPRAIVEYAYENVAGASIGAGLVPAPGAMALLALGAAGLAGRRRK